LRHKPALARLVGPTRVVDRTPKFTVTVSVRNEKARVDRHAAL
jgi:16S rRNA (guanine1207-N2)-methyltransferase